MKCILKYIFDFIFFNIYYRFGLKLIFLFSVPNFMRFIPTALIVIFVFISFFVKAQNDSTFEQLQKFPANNFLYQTQKKVDQYKERIYHKTIKSLEKLSRWEDKIKKLLDKASPETAAQLFSYDKLSFNSLLEKYKKGESVLENNMTQYDAYRDKLSTSLKYIGNTEIYFDSVLRYKCLALSNNVKQLDSKIGETEAINKIITERKKLLLAAAVQFIGKSKWLVKINKETYYYSETLINYKEIFNEPKKAESTVIKLLNNVPAFSEFFKKNSMLSTLFPIPQNYGTSISSLAGLQTRVQINNHILQQIAASGPSALEEVKQNLLEAQKKLNNLKANVIKAGGSSSDANIANFKPNTQRTKTFAQRLEYGFNMQFDKNNSLIPGAVNLGINIGYKLNNKISMGIGSSYRLGMGKLDKIRLSNEGIGIRSYFDYNLKRQIFISGGYEINKYPSLKGLNVTTLAGMKNIRAWQTSGLVGIYKKIPIKTKFTKGAKLQLLYDFLHRQHVPVSQPLIFRFGYELK